MECTLPNGKEVRLRQLQSTDGPPLLNYLTGLSVESRSRFGPHAFDAATVDEICRTVDPAIEYFIAVDPLEDEIIGYMLSLQGMLGTDRERYAAKGLSFPERETVTFAPSISDRWQGAGLGTAMARFLEQHWRRKGIRFVILWAGVQATNRKAINYYNKLGFAEAGSFWHDGKDNHDMIRELK